MAIDKQNKAHVDPHTRARRTFCLRMLFAALARIFFWAEEVVLADAYLDWYLQEYGGASGAWNCSWGTV